MIEVCVSPRSAKYRAFADSIVVNDSIGVHPFVYLFDSSGGRKELGVFIDSANGNGGRNATDYVIKVRRPGVRAEREHGIVCMFQQNMADSGRAFSQIEIATDKPLEITAVSWWSGRREPFLP
jgi:hypothetical protein